MATFPAETFVWVPDDEYVYEPAQVKNTFKAGQPGTISYINSEEGGDSTLAAAVSKDCIPCAEESLEEPDDLVDLKVLDEPTLLYTLRRRFLDDEDLIYTNIGAILVSVNPFKQLSIYSPEIVDRFIKGEHDPEENGGKPPPHIFGTADQAYNNLINNKRPQSCIISGESGAGKTEATKLFLHYLAEKASAGDAEAKTGASLLHEKILDSNPLMEAFGNAKTVRNNNSSRFGKLIEVKFDQKAGKIVGGNITEYLLEKSRLVFQASEERNYHIFYQITSHASQDAEFNKDFNLMESSQYFYTNQNNEDGRETLVQGMNDTEEFERTRNAMNTLDITPEQQHQIFLIVSGILHLGNVEFEPIAGKENCKIKESTMDMVQKAAQQLGLKVDALANALIKRKLMDTFKEHSLSEATSARDAFAKSMYGYLFSWLIAKINASLAKQSTGRDKDVVSISVLDIFGFESFKVNSFEQLCINYCNEKLQKFFNHHIFSQEQERYKAEGIDLSHLSFAFDDNSGTLTAIESKQGLLSVLDEVNKLPKGNDEVYLGKVHTMASDNAEDSNPIKKANPKEMRKDDALKISFAVKHYAGIVYYTVTGFLDKNRDKLLDDLQALGVQSSTPLINEVFKANAESNKKKTLGTQFKGQLKSLMTTLEATEPHFVRTIKPNSSKKPDEFSGTMVLEQMRYAGLAEVCRIRKLGYPVRKSFKEFVQRYRALSPTPVSDHVALCTAMEKSGILTKDEFQIGKTMVFLRNNEHTKIENEREKVLGVVIVKLQRVIRGFLLKKRFNVYKTLLASLKKTLLEVPSVRKSTGVDDALAKLDSALEASSALPNGGRNHVVVIAAVRAQGELNAQSSSVSQLRNNLDSTTKENLKYGLDVWNDFVKERQAFAVGDLLKDRYAVPGKPVKKYADLEAVVTEVYHGVSTGGLPEADKLYGEGETRLKNLGMLSEQVAAMTKALESAYDSTSQQKDTLAGAIAAAKKSPKEVFEMVVTTSEYREVEESLAFVEKIIAALGALQKAGSQEAILDSLTALQSIVSETSNYKDVQEAMQKASVKVASMAAAAEAKKKAQEKRLKNLKAVTEALSAAIKNESLVDLEKALVDAKSIGKNASAELSTLIEQGIKLQKELRAKQSHLEKIISLVKSLEEKAKSASGVSEGDDTKLQKLLDQGVTMGIQKDDEDVAEIFVFKASLTKQIAVQKTLEAAIKSNKEAELKKAQKLVQELGLVTSSAKQVDNLLESIEQERQIKEKDRIEREKKERMAKINEADDEEIEKDQDEMLKQSGEESLEFDTLLSKSMDSSKYSLDNYHRLVNIGTYMGYFASAVGERKEELKSTFLSYSRVPLPGPMIKAPTGGKYADYAKQIQKSLLQFTGDVSGGKVNGGSSLQFFLKQTLADPYVRREGYAQLIKHLTLNTRKSSEEKAWFALSMMTYYMRPDMEEIDILPFVLNFLTSKKSEAGIIGNSAQLCIAHLRARFNLNSDATGLPEIASLDEYVEKPPFYASISQVGSEEPIKAAVPAGYDISDFLTKVVCPKAGVTKKEDIPLYGLFIIDKKVVTKLSVAERLTRFYRKYNPKKLDHIDYFLKMYQGREEALLFRLEQKYGPEPTEEEEEEDKGSKKKKNFLVAAITAGMGAAKRLGIGAGNDKTPPPPQTSWPLPDWVALGQIYRRMVSQGREPLLSFKRKLYKRGEAKSAELVTQIRQDVHTGDFLLTDGPLITCCSNTLTWRITKSKKSAADLAKLYNAADKESAHDMLRQEYDFESLIPRNIVSERSLSSWMDATLSVINSDKGKSVEQLNDDLYKFCANQPGFQRCFFYLADSSDERVIAAVDNRGIFKLNRDNLNQLAYFDFFDIMEYGAAQTYFWIRIRGDKTVMFVTLQAWDLYGLVHAYTSNAKLLGLKKTT